MDSNNAKYKVISIAWGHQFIESILTPVEKNLNIDFIHLTHADDVKALKSDSYYSKKMVEIPAEPEVSSYTIDTDFLASLEKDANFTINNLILSDRILCTLRYEESLQYATCLAKELTKLFDEVNPHYIMGSWDSMVQGIGMLVARKKGIPFYIMKFSVIPSQHLAICSYPNPNHEIDFTQQTDKALLEKATDVYDKWMTKKIVAPAYVSAKTFLDIVKMLPVHTRVMAERFKKRIFSGGINKYLYYSSFSLTIQYIRKKSNILLMYKKLFITEVPTQPFFFYGLHMQPESSVDVMAPFYSNQLTVIESISRSMPADHLLLVKIHISDADNYSSAQIKKLLKIPGVRVVSPFVNSRSFIENASILFSIQGTIGLEGALLGKPVIMFGDSPVVKFPSASKVIMIEDLPALVNKKLFDPVPARDTIIPAFAQFLKSFLPSCSDDWPITLSKGLTEQEVQNFVAIFNRLNDYVQKKMVNP